MAGGPGNTRTGNRPQVLLTRPEPGLSRSAARLRKAGLSVLTSPLMRPQTSALFQLPADGDVLLVTSESALHALDERLGHERTRALLQDHDCACVGARTAAALTRMAARSPLHVGATAEDLARLLSADPRMADSHFHYLAAEDRRPALEERLKGRITTATLYRMEATGLLAPHALRALEQDRLDAVLFYSPRSANLFVTACGSGKKPGKVIPVCLSRETAAALPSDWQRASRIAASPDEDALFRQLFIALGKT